MPSIINKSGRDRAFLEQLSEENIRKHLALMDVNNIRELLVYSSITSTNDYLLKNVRNDDQIKVCVAEQQSHGRGRYGHEWESPSAVNLYLSMSWPLQVWEKRYESLSLWLLVFLAGMLESYGCTDIQLKWPNDLCVRNKKLSGILIERKVGQNNNQLVVGVGLNVAMSLDDGVKIGTPWIDLLTVKPDWCTSRNELAARVISVIDEVLSKLERNELTSLDAKWAKYDLLLNKEIEFIQQGDKRTACVKGIDEFGQIILDVDGKLESVHSAFIREIRIIGN